ncbi:hypothetical protein FIBSPDRAFT_876061 [Athelia psychrophila]|uniref:Uncharacterized protein n=1 Tax=Athelia psychrophila TaxID=1759441 RepID=A0A167X686_9AGAM|nr:hypothetical protein FIBSPDRAFT_876061 [Fibularhizoctonia sp. CBS 109695]
MLGGAIGLYRKDCLARSRESDSILRLLVLELFPSVFLRYVYSPRATYLVPTTVLSPTVRGWEDWTGGEGGRAIGKGWAISEIQRD